MMDIFKIPREYQLIIAISAFVVFIGSLIIQRVVVRNTYNYWLILINILLGCLFMHPIFSMTDVGFYALFFLPGLIFPIAITVPLKEEVTMKLIFIVISTLIYYLMVCLSLLNGYMGPNYYNIVIASIIGAFIETLLFCYIYKCLSSIKAIDIVLLSFSSLLAFIYIKIGITLNITLWQLSVGMILLMIYNRKDKQVSI